MAAIKAARRETKDNRADARLKALELRAEGMEPVSYTHLDVYKRQLYTHVHAGFDRLAKLAHNGKIKPPVCVPGESLAADLQQDALIFKLRQNEITPYLQILSYSSVSSPN